MNARIKDVEIKLIEFRHKLFFSNLWEFSEIVLV